MSVQELQTRHPTSPHTDHSGVLPDRGLEKAIEDGWISGWISRDQPYGIEQGSVQPASLDLRLNEHAWELRSSFLPDRHSTVEEKLRGVAMAEVEIGEGRTLDRNRPYLIPLVEQLALPKGIAGKANPKSSTGRLDVFTRVITDRNGRFDEIPDGYEGKLYLEVVPRSFPVKVERFLSLNQLRLTSGHPRISDDGLREIHDGGEHLLYAGGVPVPERSLETSNGLFLSVDLRQDGQKPVGYRAREDTPRLDLAATREHLWSDFWEPIYPETNGRIILNPERFYLLFSAESVCVPPKYAAEMTAYDPTAGELRTHYAGFFDPGFGYDPAGELLGSRAALEVRAHDVPFMLEHNQPICKLAFERMVEPPDRLYGEEVGSHYQAQSTTLGKHFTEPPEDEAPSAQPRRGVKNAEPTEPLFEPQD